MTGDVPVAGDYLGSGRLQVAVFRPSTAQWFVRTDGAMPAVIQWGALGDVPEPAAYTPLFGFPSLGGR